MTYTQHRKLVSIGMIPLVVSVFSLGASSVGESLTVLTDSVEHPSLWLGLLCGHRAGYRFLQCKRADPKVSPFTEALAAFSGNSPYQPKRGNPCPEL